MKISQHQLNARHCWIKQPIGAHIYKPWLQEQGSLTQKLIGANPDFHVAPVFQGFRKANRDEQMSLRVAASQNMFLREVVLYSRNQSVVFAHSITAAKHLRGRWRGLLGLGRRSLGSMLFSNPRIARTPLEFKKINRHHPLFNRVMREVDVHSTYLWARRSQFFFIGARTDVMMVTEVFLPTIASLSPCK